MIDFSKIKGKDGKELSPQAKATMRSYVRALKRGENEALKQLEEETYPMCAKLCNQMFGPNENANDLFQDSIITFIEKVKFPSFLFTCKPSTFFYSICRRMALKRLSENKKKKMKELLVLDKEFGIEPVDITNEEMERMEQKERMLQAMKVCLPSLRGKDCGKILSLFHLDGKSWNEINKAMGYQGDYGRKVKAPRCREELKKAILGYLQKNGYGKQI